MSIPVLRGKNYDSWRNPKVARSYIPTHHKKPKISAKKLIGPSLIGLAALLVIGVAYVAWISRDLPNPNQLINRQVAQSTKIYDRTGEHILYEISGDQKRTLVTLNDIPAYVKEATIAIEDKDFYKHGAFSLWAMFRSAVTDVLFHRSAGGSTLTQQFIKNAVLTNDKTFSRKIKELVLSYRLEQKFSKDEILQMYLNEIPYGSNAYGVQEASRKYFGKDIKDVDLAESAVLAAIVQLPSYYSPYGANKGLLLQRKDTVLDLMAEQGYISTAERDAAKKENILFKGPETNITAPHFVMYIKDMLINKYGEQMVEQGGLKIYTTLDLYKQQAAEEAVTTLTKNYPKKYNANNAALVAIDPKTGQILAMVGSRDYFDDSIDGQVNMATSPRQPGSSMKPIVYSALFEKGYTPNTILYDVVTNFSTDSSAPYIPHDYDLKERGPVTIRQALAGSLNIPAVEAVYLAGVNNVLDLADNLGYTTLTDRSRFGLSIVLGGAEVKLLEHANAYSALARDGQLSPVVSILKVEDKDGNILEQYQPSSKKVLDSKVVRMIDSILTDNNARTYIFGAKNSLTLGDRPVAAKTGTTNDYHDAWTIGFTPSLVTGVWVGNSDNKAMAGKPDGSIVAAPIWHYFMNKVLGNTPIETFQDPGPYTTGKPILDGELLSETIQIDKNTGRPASSSTPPELISTKTVPAYHSILYYVDKDNPLGPVPTDPTQDPQFNAWESAVQIWAGRSASSSLPLATSTPALNYNNTPGSKPTIIIDSPQANQTITTPNLEVQIEASSTRGISRTEYSINNNLWLTKWGALSSFIEPVSFLNNGYQTLEIKSCDDLDNCGTSQVNFNLLINNNPVVTSKNSIKITSPAAGLNLRATDFPLTVTATVANPLRTARVDLIVKNVTTGSLMPLSTITNLSSNNLSSVWGVAPAAGNYSLSANLYDWNGDVIKSSEVPLSVTP
jgi:1A family penicillin-binding protein